MMAAIADFLLDFGARPRPLKPAPPPEVAAVAAARAAPEQPQVDLDALIAAAVRKAEIETRDQLETLYGAQIAEDQARHEEELAKVRNQVSVELGAKVAAAMRDLEQRAVEAATGITARILARLVDEAVSREAVEALARSVRTALSDGEAIRVRVAGPQALFMPFTAAMGDHARLLDFTEADSLDLTVAIDDALFETRVGDWSSVLSGAAA